MADDLKILAKGFVSKKKKKVNNSYEVYLIDYIYNYHIINAIVYQCWGFSIFVISN